MGDASMRPTWARWLAFLVLASLVAVASCNAWLGGGSGVA